MRGDPPPPQANTWGTPASTPHARGSTRTDSLRNMRIPVYPACAGIHPEHLGPLVTIPRLPRMRGDPPQVSFGTFLRPVSTPHARGSTRLCGQAAVQAAVYPACAGIHLLKLLLDIPQ